MRQLKLMMLAGVSLVAEGVAAADGCDGRCRAASAMLMMFAGVPLVGDARVGACGACWRGACAGTCAS